MNQAAKQEVTVIEQPEQSGSNALMQIISRAAFDPACDPAKLAALLAVKKEWEADEARKAYHGAFSAFKAEAVSVIKRVGITDGPLKGKKYADLAAAVDAATPALSRFGLSASWKITKNEKEWIEVRCTLTHNMGHSEFAEFGGPPDAGGAKNAMQARASTLNYCERYSFLAVCGLASKGQDDDGRGGAGKHVMDESVKADYLSAIEAATDKATCEELWKKITASTTACGDVAAHDELRAKLFAKAKGLK